MPDRTGNASARVPLAALLEQHYGELLAFARRRIGSASLAEDVMQDAWVRVSAEKLHPAGTTGVAAVGNPVAYLYRVITNLVIDRQRQSIARERHEVDDEQATDVVATEAPSPFRVVAGQQEYALLEEAVAALPARCREVFILYRARHMSMQEIASHLGISSKTVENHIANAMVLCRRRLRDAGRWT